MNILKILEKQRDEEQIKELKTKEHLTDEEARLKYYAKELEEVLFHNTKFYNLKYISYLNHDEYRLYKIPIQTGIKRSGGHTQYETIDGKQYNKVTKEERTPESILHSEQASLYRTKQKIYEYAFANDWTNGLFFTITFNPELVDSLNYDDCYERMYQFLKNVKRQNPDFKYIFVPELHKSGRIHFHGIGANCDKLELTDSGKTKKGKKIYNINSRTFKYGFTTVSKIENTEKVSNYITKYITKELISATKGKHRYLYSKNLELAEVETVMLNDKELFMKSVELNPNVLYKKVYIDEETEQEITYIQVKK